MTTVIRRRAVFGSSVSKHLLAFEQSVGSGASLPPADADEDTPSFTAQVRHEGVSAKLDATSRDHNDANFCSELLCAKQGWVSGADYAGRKTTLVLFINGRAVECTPLKRALEATYATILPKASKPFVYLASTSVIAPNPPSRARGNAFFDVATLTPLHLDGRDLLHEQRPANMTLLVQTGPPHARTAC